MSELIIPRRTEFRWQLLATVSALSLMGSIASPAKAEEADRPTVWIELGAQAERLDNGEQAFVPPFFAHSPRASVWNVPPTSVERPARYAIGGEGKIAFEPSDSNWVFVAAIRYGRSNRSKSVQQQSNAPTLIPYNGGKIPAIPKLYDDADGKSQSSHTILDFMAGKDVGLGIFGGDSKINFGVRFAQFTSSGNASMRSRPTLGHIKLKYNSFLANPIAYYYPHNYKAAASNWRSFHGIGPSISWDASAPVIGNAQTGEVTFDWGVNAAVLFGRQKARVHHQTSGNHVQMTHLTKYNVLSSYYNPPHNTARSRSVVVPNVGGFAGVSFKFPNAKVSMGYRADFFFHAMDGGLDTAKSYNRAFYGPFATISVGLGG